MASLPWRTRAAPRVNAPWTSLSRGAQVSPPDQISDEGALHAYVAQAVEVQIDESGKNYRGSQAQPPAIFGDSRYKTGAVNGVASARQWAAKVLSPEGSDEYWNELHIKLQNNTVEVKLNGKPVCNATLPAAKVHSGLFGLRFQTGKVQFKNIRIR
jgi:hypothetical protein